MKTVKFLLVTGFITAFCLLYVWQETEILRLAYINQRQASACEELLDKNRILRYNLGKRVSVISIADKIYDRAEFAMPERFQLMRVVPARRAVLASAAAKNKENLFSRIFGIKRQAEAQTISSTNLAK